MNEFDIFGSVEAQPHRRTKPLIDLGLWTPDVRAGYSRGLGYQASLFQQAAGARFGNDVLDITGRGQDWRFQIRYPDVRIKSSVNDWHQDDTEAGEIVPWLWLWTNVWPTEVRLAGADEKDLFVLKPFHGYLVNNRQCVHRRSPKAVAAQGKSDEIRRYLGIGRFYV